MRGLLVGGSLSGKGCWALPGLPPSPLEVGAGLAPAAPLLPPPEAAASVPLGSRLCLLLGPQQLWEGLSSGEGPEMLPLLLPGPSPPHTHTHTLLEGPGDPQWGKGPLCNRALPPFPPRKLLPPTPLPGALLRLQNSQAVELMNGQLFGGVANLPGFLPGQCKMLQSRAGSRPSAHAGTRVTARAASRPASEGGAQAAPSAVPGIMRDTKGFFHPCPTHSRN